MTEQEDMEATYGLAARYSEYKRGEHITYTNEGRTCQGTIIWVSPPGPVVVGGKPLPTHYTVEPDGAGNTWPHTVFAGEIVQWRP